jgi:hypothetical protein
MRLCDAGSFAAAHAVVDGLPPDRQNLRALVLAREGRRAEARVAVKTTFDQDAPVDLRSLMWAAEMMLGLGDEVAAALYAGRAVEAGPDDWRAWEALARAQLARDRADLALAPGRRAVELADDEASAHLTLGRVLLARGFSRRRALRHLERAVALDPDHHAAVTALRRARSWRRRLLVSLGGCLTGWLTIQGGPWLLDRYVDAGPAAWAGGAVAALAAALLVTRRMERSGQGPTARVAVRRTLARQQLRIGAGWAGVAAGLAPVPVLLPLATTMLPSASLADGEPPGTALVLTAVGVLLAAGVLGPWLVGWWWGPGAVRRVLAAGWRLPLSLGGAGLLVAVVLGGMALGIPDESFWLGVAVAHIASLVAALGLSLAAVRSTSRG